MDTFLIKKSSCRFLNNSVESIDFTVKYLIYFFLNYKYKSICFICCMLHFVLPAFRTSYVLADFSILLPFAHDSDNMYKLKL